MLKAKPLISIGATVLFLSLVLLYMQDDPTAAIIVVLLLGMLAALVGSVRLCPQLSVLRLLLAALCSVGVGVSILWVASWTSDGLDPHGFGIILALPVFEAFLLALIFGMCAISRRFVRGNSGPV